MRSSYDDTPTVAHSGQATGLWAEIGRLVASRIKSKWIPANIFTARKRSLRRLCFYRCLSVHNWGGACVVFFGGVCVVFSGGGVHGFFQGHALFLPGGVCVVFSGGGGGGCGFSGGVRGFFLGVRGMHGFFWGACMVFSGGCACFFPGGRA